MQNSARSETSIGSQSATRVGPGIRNRCLTFVFQASNILGAGHHRPVREGMLLLDLVVGPTGPVELRQDVDATRIGFSPGYGPVCPAPSPVGCAGPQSLVAKSALFLLVSPDATWSRGPGGFTRSRVGGSAGGPSSVNVRKNPILAPLEWPCKSPHQEFRNLN
jgi:hypothetical protein